MALHPDQTMAISPTIEREIQRQIEQDCKPPAAASGYTRAAEYIRAHGLKIETLALDGEPLAALRARLEAAYAAYAPATPGEVALVEQVVTSSLEAERCRRLQARLRTEKSRTALFRWEQEQADAVAKYARMLDPHVHEALPQLKKTAAGCRYIASEWRRLAAVLAPEGTWYQLDRIKAILLQGYSAMVNDLYFSEEAYLTWVHCLGAQPNPKQRDIDLILDSRVMPKRFQDRDEAVWPTDPAASRAYLEAIVARELPRIVALEEKLRVELEEPARAVAQELDQIANSQHEARLVRDLRSHERSVQSAHQALMKRKPRRV
jgi:hypothetical protein